MQHQLGLKHGFIKRVPIIRPFPSLIMKTKIWGESGFRKKWSYQAVHYEYNAIDLVQSWPIHISYIYFFRGLFCTVPYLCIAVTYKLPKNWRKRALSIFCINFFFRILNVGNVCLSLCNIFIFFKVNLTLWLLLYCLFNRGNVKDNSELKWIKTLYLTFWLF